MSVKLLRKAAKDATLGELVIFIELHGIDVPASLRSQKLELISLMKSANLPDPITVAADGDEPVRVSDDLGNLFETEFSDETERWVRIRLARDIHAEDEGSAVPVIYKHDRVFLPRLRDIVVRERFVRVLNDAKEGRVKQAAGDGTQKFSEATKYFEERAPFTFLGTCGLVSQGPPTGLPATVHVIQ